MSTEDTIIEIRKQKHQDLNHGTYPVSNGGVSINEVLLLMNCEAISKSLIASLNASELDREVTVHGRIINHRKLGSIEFIKLNDGTNSIQIIINKKTHTSDHLSLLDLGDIIEVSGYLCLSKTGEKSILLKEWQCLTKAYRSPPEKFAGLSDTEIKYRKRYLDLMSSEESRAVFIIRSTVISYLRYYMGIRDFMEVETSTLNSVNSGANAKPFVTHHNSLDIDLYLRIAPELYLKRLLVGGFPRVFEIGRAYRNEGLSTRHNPEFTLMECYKAYGKFDELIPFTQDLLQGVEQFLTEFLKNSFALKYFKKGQEKRTFTFEQPVKITMEQSVQKALDKLQMKAYLDKPQYGEWYQLTPPEYWTDITSHRLAKINLMSLFFELNKSKSRGERVSIFFDHLVEPFLTEDYRTEDNSKSVPVFITEYPSEICPLARRNDDNPNVCDRFELFVDGRELANAFQELNDPKQQALNFTNQLSGAEKDPMDFDSDYIEALEYGLPPCIGLGMGVCRLVQLITNSSSIKDVILFPTLRPNS